MIAFFGFGAIPSRRHGSPLERARGPLVPLCVAPHVCATAPGGRPFRCPGDVGPEGRPPFVGRVFRTCAKPVTGPVLRPSCHVPQHTMPGSGRAPGPPAGPGSFFGHCGKFGCFPPSETPSELLIRGYIYIPGCNQVKDPRMQLQGFRWPSAWRHATPVLCSTISSPGANSHPQWSCSTSLPTGVAKSVVNLLQILGPQPTSSVVHYPLCESQHLAAGR